MRAARERTWRITEGDCIEAMAAMDEASVDAIVCDPPYGLEFMGKDWDRFAGRAVGASERAEHMNRSKSYGPWGRRDRPIMPNDNGRRNERCLKCGKWRISSNRCTCANPEWEYRTRDEAPPAMRAFQEWTREWAHEAKRVLKPGGHLLAFGGTRTYHRLACAIEDAGFEIRDSIGWQHMEPVFCRCGSLPYGNESVSREGVRGLRSDVAADDAVPSCTEQDLRAKVCGEGGEPCEAGDTTAGVAETDDADLSGVWSGVRDPHLPVEAGKEPHLLSSMQREAAGRRVGEARPQGPSGVDGREPRELHGEDERPAESGLEGRGDVLAEEGQLPGDQVRPSPRVGAADGPEGRVHHGTSPSDGTAGRAAPNADGSGSPHRPQPTEQRADESRTLAVEWISQGGGAWPGCPRCGKPLAPPFFPSPLAWDYGSGFPS